MLSKRTSIGIGVGAAIIAIGLYSLISSLGLQTIQVDDTYVIGDSTTYKFTAPENAAQDLQITGNSFNVKLTSPKGGLQIPGTDHKDELSIQWVHLKEGQSTLIIKNTGDSEIQVKGSLQALIDPIQITFHVLVVIAGLVIIGFSSAFSIRKPRGF